MLIKEKLKNTLAMLDGVKVDGLDNMKRFVLATEGIKACITAIETAEREVAQNENDHDQQREGA